MEYLILRIIGGFIFGGIGYACTNTSAGFWLGAFLWPFGIIIALLMKMQEQQGTARPVSSPVDTVGRCAENITALSKETGWSSERISEALREIEFSPYEFQRGLVMKLKESHALSGTEIKSMAEHMMQSQRRQRTGAAP